MFSGQALWHLKGAVAIHTEPHFSSEIAETMGSLELFILTRDSTGLTALFHQYGFSLGNQRGDPRKIFLLNVSPPGVPGAVEEICRIQVSEKTSLGIPIASRQAFSNEFTFIFLEEFQPKEDLKIRRHHAGLYQETLRGHNSLYQEDFALFHRKNESP